VVSAVVFACVLASVPSRAMMLSKEYAFKPHIELVIGAEVREGQQGVRLDTVQFLFPDTSKMVRFSNAIKVDVSLSNIGTLSQKVGVAIALYADDGALVGVASGGSKWMAIKPDRRSFYTMKFSDVDSRISEATRFRITLETK
jgi:hypothetical protein